jgi:hypothetical protein
MLRFAADENLHNNILHGLLRRKPDLDIVRIQDTRHSGETDPEILEWLAQEGRVLLTHDVATMTRCANERIIAGQRMPGVFIVSRSASLGRIIEDILMLEGASLEGEWEGQIRYLPLR